MLYALIQGLGYTSIVSDAYRSHYISMTNKIFSDFKGDGVVEATKNEDPNENELDVVIRLHNKAQWADAIKNRTIRRRVKTLNYTKFLGYLPISILLALVLATPLNWKQKLIALVLGLVLVELFIIFRLWIHILYNFNNYEGGVLNVVHLSSMQNRLIEFLSAIFISNVVVTVVVPFMIWMLVAIMPFPSSPITSRLNKLLSRPI